LLETTNYSIRAISRHPQALETVPDYASRVELLAIDIFDTPALTAALQGVERAVYLVHMMASKGDYYQLEAKAADSFGNAAAAAGLRRVVYMGGLGNDADKLSRHLRSRHNTGNVLRQHLPLVVELRASMIIGDGSIGYDIMKSLVHKLPLQTMPAWAVTKTQPICLHDALLYVAAALEIPLQDHEIVEIGGPVQMSYKDIVGHYAAYKGKKPILILVPIVPIWLAAWWLNLFTPRSHARVGRSMAESLVNPMVVTNNRSKELFPDIIPQPIESAYKL
jgi:uncharacterized protein YbjT (DUF2867 family)